MKLALAKALVELVQEQGGDAELREDYSGRSMYGKTTCGVVVDNFSDLLVAVINDAIEGQNGFIYQACVENENGGEPISMIRSLGTDNMGFSTIVY